MTRAAVGAVAGAGRAASRACAIARSSNARLKRELDYRFRYPSYVEGEQAIEAEEGGTPSPAPAPPTAAPTAAPPTTPRSAALDRSAAPARRSPRRSHRAPRRRRRQDGARHARARARVYCREFRGRSTEELERGLEAEQLVERVLVAALRLGVVLGEDGLALRPPTEAPTCAWPTRAAWPSCRAPPWRASSTCDAWSRRRVVGAGHRRETALAGGRSRRATGVAVGVGATGAIATAATGGGVGERVSCTMVIIEPITMTPKMPPSVAPSHLGIRQGLCTA